MVQSVIRSPHIMRCLVVTSSKLKCLLSPNCSQLGGHIRIPCATSPLTNVSSILARTYGLKHVGSHSTRENCYALFSSSKTFLPSLECTRAVRTGSKKWTPGVPVYKVPMEDQEVMVEDSGESKQVTREVLTRINEQIKDHSHSRLFAVVKMASWQYKVTVNDLIAPQIWLEADIGDRIVLEKVLLVGGREWSLIGQPILPKDLVRIEATVVEKTLTHTFTSFFMIKRKRHRRMHFFKYPLAVLRINSIEMKRPLHSP